MADLLVRRKVVVLVHKMEYSMVILLAVVLELYWVELRDSSMEIHSVEMMVGMTDSR